MSTLNSLVHPETPFMYLWLLTDGHLPGPVWPLCRSHWAAPRNGEGRDDTWPPTSSFPCYSWRFMVPARVLYMGTWTSTCERTLRGLVRRECTANATHCCFLGNNDDRASHFIEWLLIRLLHVFEFATQWVFTTVSLANLLWLFLLGSCPFRCFLCCPCDGETQIWLGDLRLALWLWCFVFGGHDLPIRMRPPVSMLKFSR